MNYEKDFEDRYIDTAYGKIHYLHHQGSGARIIFIHGFASNARTWRRMVGFLPDSLDIYLIDLLGHGSSDAPVIDYSVKVQVTILAEFIEKNKLADYYLYGHSYGAWIIGLYASSHQDEKGLIFEDAVGMQEFWDDRANADPEYKAQVAKEALAMNPKKHVIMSMVDIDHTGEFIDRVEFSKIDKPTLVLWGAKDDTVDIKYSKFFLDCIKGSRLEIIDDAAHTPHFTDPEKTSKLLLDFIGR